FVFLAHETQCVSDRLRFVLMLWCARVRLRVGAPLALVADQRVNLWRNAVADYRLLAALGQRVKFGIGQLVAGVVVAALLRQLALLLAVVYRVLELLAQR